MRERPTVAVEFWGSDCVRCFNSTPHSMTCDQCERSDATVALYYDEDQWEAAAKNCEQQ